VVLLVAWPMVDPAGRTVTAPVDAEALGMWLQQVAA
jgi:hypothetical protein